MHDHSALVMSRHSARRSTGILVAVFSFVAAIGLSVGGNSSSVLAEVGGFSSTAGTSPLSVVRGQSIGVMTSVTATSSRKANVDVEVYFGSKQVYQRLWQNQSFVAGVARTYGFTWLVPANSALGSYTVKGGTMSTTWRTLYSWNNQAATFAVTDPARRDVSPTPPPPTVAPDVSTTAA